MSHFRTKPQNDCAPSENSDQPGHPPSLIRVFAVRILGIHPAWSESSLCAQWIAKDPSFLHADSEDSGQNGQIPRLIWVFAGRTCHFVGFVTRRLKWGYAINQIKNNLTLWYLKKASAVVYASRVWTIPSRDMTKPTKWVRAQWRLRSAWAFAQSDQNLRCALSG